jgi:hypothetical protein
METINQITVSEIADGEWKNCYKTSGAASLTMVIIILIQSPIFIACLPPSTALDYVTLFQKN